MNATTLKALRASIAHWKRMATGKQRKHEAPNGDNCSLCARFNNTWFSTCTGCPVANKTGRPILAGSRGHDDQCNGCAARPDSREQTRGEDAMRKHRTNQYLAGDAEPSPIKRLRGMSNAEERKRMSEWLTKRGETKGWRKFKTGKA